MSSCCRSQPEGLIVLVFFHIKWDNYLTHKFTGNAETSSTVLKMSGLYSSGASRHLGVLGLFVVKTSLSQRSFSFVPFKKTPDKKHMVSSVVWEEKIVPSLQNSVLSQQEGKYASGKHDPLQECLSHRLPRSQGTRRSRNCPWTEYVSPKSKAPCRLISSTICTCSCTLKYLCIVASFIRSKDCFIRSN